MVDSRGPEGDADPSETAGADSGSDPRSGSEVGTDSSSDSEAEAEPGTETKTETRTGTETGAKTETGTAADDGNGDDGEEPSTEELRARVEKQYDFEEFGAAEMAEMSVEEWEAVFDPDAWLTGEGLLDRVERELRSNVRRREVFAVVGCGSGLGLGPGPGRSPGVPARRGRAARRR